MRNIKALSVVVLSVLAVGCGIDTSGDEAEFPAAAGSAGSAGTSIGGSSGVGGTAQGGSAGTPAKCVQGQQIVCDCAGGLKGVQVCNAQNTYGACDCTQPDAGTSGAGGSGQPSTGGSSGTGGTSAGGAGGSSQGGSSTGGSSTGGSSQGGSSGVGGTSTGGSSTGGTAGTSQGGSAGVGGTPTGGSSGTGGTAQGGSSGTGGTGGWNSCNTKERRLHDKDGDGYGDPNDYLFVSPCDAWLPGYVNWITGNDDCDDNNASVHPKAVELCNGVDDNCNNQIDEGCSVSQDKDGDGFTVAQGDCNDNDPAMNPGVSYESCDGKDNDCNGLVDEGCGVPPQMWYRDVDGDGYGVSSIWQYTNLQPQGYVLKIGDCDDTKSDVNPGAAEQCNGVDDNCNGQTDEGCSVSQDKDGDGRTVAQGDCNDNDANIFGPNGNQPAATELCDGKDNDCDGQIDEGCGTPSATKLVCFYRVFLPDVAKHDYYAVLWGAGSQTVPTYNAVWGTFTVQNPKENDEFLFSTYRDPPSNNIWQYAGCQWDNPSQLQFEFACYIEKNGNKYATPEVQGVWNNQHNGCNLRVMVQASGATDWDTDGFVLPHDCNDLSGDTHPGATDLVGGPDANCNGVTDW